MAVHSIPFISASINMFYLSDTICYTSDSWVVPVISVSYLIVLWSIEYFAGVALYPFTSYKQWESFLFAFILISVAFFFQIGLAHFTQYIHGRYEMDTDWL